MKRLLSILLMLVFFPIVCSAEAERAGEDVEDPKPLVDIAQQNQSYTDGKPGFMIITTNDLTHRLESLQKFVSHKSKNRGFRVFVATENDWEDKYELGKRARENGLNIGQTAAHDILGYLKANYKKFGLKYVIFIGDARPDVGTTPMIRASGETTDYPYVDLDTDWDVNKDSILESAEDKNAAHTREPEVYVGRIPYYGDKSWFGKVSDTDAILERMIRYDTEKDINWRYHVMVEYKSELSDFVPYMEKIGFNYTLMSRFKSKVVGLPAVRSKNGGEHMLNLDQIMTYGVGFKNCHSHGYSRGMEGFHSNYVMKIKDSKHPTVLTLGACYVGDINDHRNLSYALLRFQSVAVSGGTNAVTNYGGDLGGAYKRKKTKAHLLFAGKSVGEAHWGWYGELFRNRKSVAHTSLKINIYGDPSAVPLRYGAEPPYPFIAKPVAGYYGIALSPDKVDDIPSHNITLSNNKDVETEVTIKPKYPWVVADTEVVNLVPGESCEINLSLDSSKKKGGFKPGEVYECDINLEADNGYKCTRRFVIKVRGNKMRYFYNFNNNSENLVPKQFKGKDRYFHIPQNESAYVKGRFGEGNNGMYPAGGYFYPFEKEDFTIGFHVKFNDTKALISGNKVWLLKAKDFFKLTKSDRDILLRVKNHKGLGQTQEKCEIRVPFNWEKDRWYHLAFSVEQSTGSVKLYADGKEIGSGSMPAYQIYHMSGISFGKWNAVYDDLFGYKKALNKDELKEIIKGNVFFDIKPALNNVVSPVNVEFTGLSSAQFKYMAVEYYPADKPENIKILSPEKGKFIAPRLEGGKTYKWRFTGTESRSSLYEFKTFDFAGEGKILKSIYKNVRGSRVEDLEAASSYPGAPDVTEEISRMKVSGTGMNSFGTRIFGYIHPPVTGKYRFWISGDDSCKLNLSSDESEINKTTIAFNESHTGIDHWDKNSSQRSKEIYLEKGKKYFIEALHKEYKGADHLSAAWKIPGTGKKEIIEGFYLSRPEQ